jgi:hypothetical protein
MAGLRVENRDKISKRELLRELKGSNAVAQIHMRLSKMLAVELRRLAPEHEVFTDGTFSEDSIKSIDADVKMFADYHTMRQVR